MANLPGYSVIIKNHFAKKINFFFFKNKGPPKYLNLDSANYIATLYGNTDDGFFSPSDEKVISTV